MTTPKPQDVPEAIQAPYKISELHVQDRAFYNEAGQLVSNQWAWKEITTFQSAIRKRQLAGGDPRYSEIDRGAAGLRYSKLWDTGEPSSTDSTQAMNGSKSTNNDGGPVARSDALRKLACIHSFMGKKNRQIVMKVCGQNYWASAAIREVCNDFEDSVSARLREAIDDLCWAMAEARRTQYRVIDMTVRP